MGVSLSTGIQSYKDPEGMPDPALPSRFDPNYGFPNGRKKREMKISDEELDRYGIENERRDYCAHLYVAYRRCQWENNPWAAFQCASKLHEYETCQYEDQILRMKEFERERRLIQRERRLKQQEQQQEQQQSSGNASS